MTEQPRQREWLTAAEFAEAVGIGLRSAKSALRAAVDGKTWHKHQLDVRELCDDRGKVMVREVHASILDAIAPTPPRQPRIQCDDSLLSPAARELARRMKIIEPALRQLPASAGRAAAVAEAARASGHNRATLYRWINAVEKGGREALLPVRRFRADKRKRKCHVTRAWDAAAPFDDETKARIAEDLERHIRSLWAAAPDYGRRHVTWLASHRLAELTAEAGFDPGAAELERICRLPQNRTRRNWRKYRNIAIYDHDQKRWQDENRPRISRTREGLRPMQVVSGDVHPIDILLPRADGSTFTAKLIAFLDEATGRLFGWPVFLPKGEGVRQEHVAAAFIAMTQDPAWGLPETIYIDNGGEYGCADMITDAIALARRVRLMDGETAELPGDREIIRALPYNAAAKGNMEGAFARLERGFLSMLPGHIGGDRMKKKTANVGRVPAPYPHGRAAFERDLHKAIRAYNDKPQSGELKDRSPRQAFDTAVAEGWGPFGIEFDAIAAAFCREDHRNMGRDGISFNGQLYRAPALDRVSADKRLRLRVPIFRGVEAIFVMNDDDSILCVARPDEKFTMLGKDGSAEAGRRHSAARAGVKDARGDVDRIDLRELLDRLTTKAGPDPEPVAMVRLDEGQREAGRAMRQTKAQRRAADEEADQISLNRMLEAGERYFGARKREAAG